MPKVLPNTKSSTVRGSPRNSELKSSFQQRTIQLNDGENYKVTKTVVIQYI